MYPALAYEIARLVQQRLKEGDHPTTEQFSTEQLESTVDELMRQLDIRDKQISNFREEYGRAMQEAIKHLKYMNAGAEGRLDDVAKRFAGYALASVEHVMKRRQITAEGVE